MGTNTLFRLVLVFGYCVIGFNKTCNDILETGINYKHIKPRQVAARFFIIIKFSTFISTKT